MRIFGTNATTTATAAVAVAVVYERGQMSKGARVSDDERVVVVSQDIELSSLCVCVFTYHENKGKRQKKRSHKFSGVLSGAGVLPLVHTHTYTDERRVNDLPSRHVFSIDIKPSRGTVLFIHVPVYGDGGYCRQWFTPVPTTNNI